MLVELRQSPNRFDDVSRVIHNDDRRRTQARPLFAQIIKIHDRVAHLGTGDHWNRRPAGDHCLEVIPTSANTTAMLFDQLFECDAHRFFDNARVVDVTRDRKQFGARIVRAAKAGKPFRPAAQNSRHNGNRFHVVHRGRAAIQTRASRKRRLHPWHAFFALKAFKQRCFLAADIGTCPVGHIDVKIISRFTGVLANQPRIIGFVDCSLKRLALADIFATDVDVARVGLHGKTGNQTAFDQRMRIMAHDLAVFAGARFGFIRVYHQIAGAPVAFLGHKRPFQTRRKTRAATTAQAGRLHLVDNPVAPVFKDASRAIPMAPRLRPFERAVVHTIDIGKDTVLILKHEANLYVSRLAARARLI